MASTAASYSNSGISIIPNPVPTGTGGETYKYASVGGSHHRKQSHRKLTHRKRNFYKNNPHKFKKKSFRSNSSKRSKSFLSFLGL